MTLTKKIEAMSESRERPILFSAPMVRAILNGSKTQTRRVMKVQPSDVSAACPYSGPSEPHAIYPDACSCISIRCPYGKPGDRLWVRETFASTEYEKPTEGDEVVYRADGDFYGVGFTWKPSIFMPRWACRITLEITDVRVERLQDVSEEDAIAEGVERWVVGEGWREYGLSKEDEAVCGPPMTTARDSYRSLWDSINGEGAWDKGPWVWRITFRRLETR